MTTYKGHWKGQPWRVSHSFCGMPVAGKGSIANEVVAKNSRNRSGELFVLVASLLVCGCFPKDSSPELKYLPRSDGAVVGYRLTVRNGLKSPVIVRFDENPPFTLERWQFVTLSRGVHRVSIASADDHGITAENSFDLSEPAVLTVRSPAAANSANLQAIEWSEEPGGNIVLGSAENGTYAEMEIEQQGSWNVGGVITVTIDDYPPIRLIPPYMRFVDLELGRHSVDVLVPPYEDRQARHYHSTFDIEAPAKVVVYCPVCWRDASAEGMHCESRTTGSPISD